MNESTLCFLRFIEQKSHQHGIYAFAEWRAFWLRELVDDPYYMDWVLTKGLVDD